MTPAPKPRALGFALSGCRVEVEGSALHDEDDTWDATWFSVTAVCEVPGASVRVRCAVLTSWSVKRFREGLLSLAAGQTGCAVLASETPCLSLCLRHDSGDQPVMLRVDMTPDRGSQGHWFSLPVDRAALPSLIEQCGRILSAFPPHELAERE